MILRCHDKYMHYILKNICSVMLPYLQRESLHVLILEDAIWSDLQFSPCGCIVCSSPKGCTRGCTSGKVAGSQANGIFFISKLLYILGYY